MRALLASALLALGAAAPPLPAPVSGEKAVLAVVMTRHGVRSFIKTPPAYTWPDWSPVAPSFLTEHGYVLVTYLGRYYRRYFASIGLPMGCTHNGTYVYADVDQRTLETGRALIEGACGSANALPLYHDAAIGPGVSDSLFDGAALLTRAGKVDTVASRASVAAALPHPPGAIVTQHAAEFAALQALLDARCSGTCPAASTGTSEIVAKPGKLATLHGPIDTAAMYASSLSLEQTQCGPPIDASRLAQTTKLLVLDFNVNVRNGYNSEVRGANILAHIVGLLQAKAGLPHPDVSVPDVAGTNVVILSGHDTQLSVLGGILHAHWNLGGGFVADDIPPGGALVLVLYREPSGDYRVRVHFVYERMAQLRSASALRGGVATSSVAEFSLAALAARARGLAQRGFVVHDWTKASDARVDLAPLRDPAWTKCNP